MRGAVAGALSIALAALALGAPDASARAWIAFLPAGADESRPLLDELAARGMAIGMTSPTVGGFKPRQMALDVSQGTRIPTRLYSGETGPLRFRDGRLSGWTRTRRRAEDAPGDLRPGLLASSVKSGGGSVGWAGPVGRFAPGAVVAADEGGRVERAGPDDTLTVLDLPAGRAGLRALDELLEDRRARDLVYVVRAPRGEDLRLLPSGLIAPGVRGKLRSDTTRRDGLIAATDVAPTVLDALAIPVPDEMQGQVIEGVGEADASAVREMADRLEVVSKRRGGVLMWIAGCAALLLVLAALEARGRGGGVAVRTALLGVLWIPGLALLTAAVEPGRSAEGAIIAVGALGLGVLTDRLVRWPVAPAVPALVVFATHAVDLARGSRLIGASLAGPNPAGGARFYGVGNELETLLSLAVLVGLGAALAYRPRPVVFGVGAAAAALIMGAGRLGADVGAVITLGAGGAAAVVMCISPRPSRRLIALAVAAPPAALALLVLIDLATGGDAHFTRSVLDAESGDDLLDVVQRRFEGSFSSLEKPGWIAATVLAAAGLGWLAAHRRRLLAGLPPGFAAGLAGAWFAVVIGALANDSGPQILVVGAVVVLLTAMYASAEPSPQLARMSRGRFRS